MTRKQKKKLGLKSVRQRLFRGYARTEEENRACLGIFNEKKERVYQLIRTFPYLDKGEKKGMINYLDKFYRIINNPREVKFYFVERCRKKEEE